MPACRWVPLLGSLFAASAALSCSSTDTSGLRANDGPRGGGTAGGGAGGAGGSGEAGAAGTAGGGAGGSSGVDGECVLEQDGRLVPRSCDLCADAECCEEQQGCDVGTPCGDLEHCVDTQCGSLDQYTCTEPGRPCEGLSTPAAIAAWNAKSDCLRIGPCMEACAQTCPSALVWQNAVCDSCVRGGCCAELQACDLGTPCGFLLACRGEFDCRNEACVDEHCAAERVAGEAGYGELSRCMFTECEDECYGGQSEAAGTGLGLSPLPPRF